MPIASTSGSRKYMRYTTDDGQVFAFNGDESNVENMMIGQAFDVTTVNQPMWTLPGNLTPRTAVFTDQFGRIKKVIVPTLAAFADLRAGTATVALNTWTDGTDGTSYSLVRLRPEIADLVYPGDTGLNDGDIS